MKNKEELNIYNNEYNDDARAVDESELLPIYDTMNFSGDIQPVEDVLVPDYDISEYSDERTEGQKNDSKKKITPFFAVFNKRIKTNKKFKKVIMAVLSVVIVVAVIFSAVAVAIRSGTNTSPVQSVYTADGKNELVLENEKVYSLPEAEEIKISKDGMMLYYSTNTASKTGKFDIKVVNISKKDSLNKEGSYVERGVDEGWKINSDGSFLCYSKTEEGLKNFYIYDAEKGTSESVSTNIEEVFLPQNGDVVYFTRRISSVYSLHRKRIGEASQNVASEISHVAFYDSEDGSEVLYTAETGKGTEVDVFSVKGFEMPTTVCEDVSEVYINDYSVNGNLYYFKKNTSSIDWRDFINDPYYEKDATLERPSEGDYMKNVGFIFDRYVVDYNAYNAAKKVYDAKLLRDSIREELDSIDLGLAVDKTYSCFVYNGKSKELASGILLDSVLCYSTEGTPRILYAKSVLEVEEQIEMDELVKITKNENATAAADYVVDVVGGTDELSDESIYAWYDSSKVAELEFEKYNLKRARFVFGSKDYVFAVSGGKLYYNEITEEAVIDAELVDSDVSTFEYKNGYVYYTKEDEAGNTSLYRYSVSGGIEHLADNLYDYFVIEDDYVLILSGQHDGTELMSVAVFEKGKYTEIDEDVSLNNFVYNGKKIAYVKNVGAYDTYSSGDMYTYSPENGVQQIQSDVTAIYYVNKS